MEEGGIFYLLILVVTPALGWTPQNDRDVQFFFPSKYFYNSGYGVGEFLESLKDMGYKNELIERFNKTPKHAFEFGYEGNGKGTGKIEMTRVFANIVRVSKDVYLGKEFVETLWDDRKSKTKLTQEGATRLLIHQKIDGGLNVTTYFAGIAGEGVFEMTAQVNDKTIRTYKLVTWNR